MLKKINCCVLKLLTWPLEPPHKCSGGRPFQVARSEHTYRSLRWMRKNMTVSQQLPCQCVQKWTLCPRGWTTVESSVAQEPGHRPSGPALPSHCGGAAFLTSPQPLSSCLPLFVLRFSNLVHRSTCPVTMCISHSGFLRRIWLAWPSYDLWSELPGPIIS